MPANERNEKLTRARLRASHADRDQAIDRLKAAFVQGRLTKGELETRAAQAFSARTYADLFALTADLPVEPAIAEPAVAKPPGQPAPAQPRRPVHPSIKVGAGALALITTAWIILAIVTGAPAGFFVGTLLIIVFGVPAATVVALPILAVLELESRRRKRTGGQLPPRQTPGTPCQAPRPAIEPPPIDRDHPAAEATRPRSPSAHRPAIAYASH
jgi:uncharacterized protein DUF1707